jgi:hypothetical protein
MSDHKEHKNNWMRSLLDYLSDKLTGRERNSFERGLEKDSFEAEALEGLSSLSEDELSEDLELLYARLHKRTKRKSRFPLIRIAAGFAILAVMSVSYFLIFDNEMKNSGDYTLGESVVEKEVLRDSVLSKTTMEKDLSETRPSEEKSGKSEKTIPAKSEEPTMESDRKEIQDPEITAIADMEVEAMKEDIPDIADQEFAESIVSIDEMEITEAPAMNIEKAKSEAAVPARLSKMAATKKSVPEKEGTIKGKVISVEDSLPIPGATIQIRGLAGGTVTDVDGMFELDAKLDSETVVTASMIGMTTEEVQVDTSGLAEIVMQPDELTLNEVVVVGYGSKSSAREVINSDSQEQAIQDNYSPAVPENGYESFKNYIKENLVFPDEITEINRAVVILKTTISEEGIPENIRIIKSPDKAFSNQAIRLLQGGPAWIPSSRDGEYLEEEVRVRIVFKRKD